MLQLQLLYLIQAVGALRLAVTGAHGYLGSEICWAATSAGHEVRAIGRGGASTYAHRLPKGCEVLDLEDLTDAVIAREAADGVDAVIHTAGVFRACEDMESDLVRPNLLLAENMVAACAAANARLVLTSSMAAVRGEGQQPANGKFYNALSDWNTISQRDGPGFAPYQFSKMESERRAWQLAREVGLEMVSICPAMLFGPPRDPTSSAVSVNMVRQWANGEAAVRSTLVSDVRDVARAHVEAATRPAAAGKRFIVACEARSAASSEAAAVAQGLIKRADVLDSAKDKVHAGENQELGEGNGAVAIGDKEVDAEPAATVLGVRCRSSAESLADMVMALDL